MPRRTPTELEVLAVPLFKRNNLLNGYKVYKDADEYVLVEAETATEAIERSGITDVYKIIHESRRMDNVIKETSLCKEGAFSFPTAPSADEIDADKSNEPLSHEEHINALHQMAFLQDKKDSME